MYVFTRKCGSSICHVLLTTKHQSAGALIRIHRQQTIYWIFTQTKLSSIYRHELTVTHWALIKHQALLTIQAKLKLAIIIIFFTFRYTLAKSFQACGKRRETFNSLNAAISKYISLVFCCVTQKLLIFNICETYRGAMRSSCKRS